MRTPQPGLSCIRCLPTATHRRQAVLWVSRQNRQTRKAPHKPNRHDATCLTADKRFRNEPSLVIICARLYPTNCIMTVKNMSKFYAYSGVIIKVVTQRPIAKGRWLDTMPPGCLRERASEKTRLERTASRQLDRRQNVLGVDNRAAPHVEIEFDSSRRVGGSITSTRGGWGTRIRRGCARLFVSSEDDRRNSRYF